MHRIKKGNQWHFGIKAYIGVEGDLGLVHIVVTTAANVNNVTQVHAFMEKRRMRLEMRAIPT